MNKSQIDIEATIQKTPFTMSPLAKLTEAIVEMTKVRSSYILVVEQQQLLGIFTERDLVRLVAKKTNFKHLSLADVMTRKLITISQEEIKDIFQTSKILNQFRIRHLPIINKERKLIGIITSQSIHKAMKPEYLLRYVRVAEAMVTRVISGFPEESVFELTQKMVTHRVSCIVIVERETNIPLGIITERDVAQFQTLNLDLEAISAREAMSTPLETLQPNDSLWIVSQKMQQLRVCRLVVVRSRQLAGIVTQTQMLKLSVCERRPSRPVKG